MKKINPYLHSLKSDYVAHYRPCFDKVTISCCRFPRTY